MPKNPHEMLDFLLAEVNRLKADRNESDIGLEDKYWEALDKYRVALNENDGLHIPLEKVKEEKPAEAVTFKSAEEQLKSIGL